MPSSTPVFKCGNSSDRSTVVYVPGSSFYLEVRRGDITWTASFRKAHPDVMQRTWATLTEWRAAVSDQSIDVVKERPSIAQQLLQLLNSVESATTADSNLRCIDSLLSYMLTSEALAFILHPSRHTFRDTISDKMKEILAKKTPHSLRAKAQILLHEFAHAHVLEVAEKPFSFAGMTFTDEEASPAPVANPFEEIHDMFFCVEEELYDENNGSEYKHKLIHEFVSFCMRPAFAAIWRSSTFERIQMRATLTTWLDFPPEGDATASAAAIKSFLETYPV